MCNRRRSRMTPHLIDELRSRPDEAYVTPEAIFVWSSTERRLLTFVGDQDFTKLSDAEINAFIQKQLTARKPNR